MNDDELELEEGDIVLVMEKCDDGWFVGTSTRTHMFGTFPGNYVEKICKYFLLLHTDVNTEYRNTRQAKIHTLHRTIFEFFCFVCCCCCYC